MSDMKKIYLKLLGKEGRHFQWKSISFRKGHGAGGTLFLVGLGG